MWIRVCFFFNDTATTEIYTLSLHDALPIFMDDDAYDLAATGVGVVEADSVLGSERVREGDVVIAMASSGLHSNGFALVRHALLGAGRMRIDRYVDELEATLGEVLLEPTRIYARQCLALIEE